MNGVRAVLGGSSGPPVFFVVYNLCCLLGKFTYYATHVTYYATYVTYYATYVTYYATYVTYYATYMLSGTFGFNLEVYLFPSFFLQNLDIFLHFWRPRFICLDQNDSAERVSIVDSVNRMAFRSRITGGNHQDIFLCRSLVFICLA